MAPFDSEVDPTSASARLLNTLIQRFSLLLEVVIETFVSAPSSAMVFVIIEAAYKAELLREGIIFLIHLFARAILLMKKLKIEETKAT